MNKKGEIPFNSIKQDAYWTAPKILLSVIKY